MLNLKKYIYIPIIFIFILQSCGYRVQTLPEAIECYVNLREIKNSTYIPNLEDRLRYILTDELLKNGCSMRDDDESITITGRIDNIQMDIVAEKGGMNFYEIKITSYFSIMMPDKKIIERKVTHPFISDYTAGKTIEEIIAMRDMEVDRLLRDISREVIRIIVKEIEKK